MHRKGMFVKNAEGLVGIVFELSGSTAEVHVINDDGETVMVRKSQNVSDWPQAALADVPVSRRAEPAVMARLGYV
jgi:cell shape-determining protein MreC